MVTKRTGNPPHRPKVALRDHRERLLRALQVVLTGCGIDTHKATQLIALFSEFPEVDVEVSFKARFPATDDFSPVGFDLSKIARGAKGKRPLERLKSRIDYLQAMRVLLMTIVTGSCALRPPFF
jgi:hypothetical protein